MHFPAPDVSLYELAQRAAALSSVLQVSPPTFKSLVGTVLDTLSDQKIAAFVWVKLPKGDAWEAELNRYHRVSELNSTIYLFRNQREGTESASETKKATPERSLRYVDVPLESPLRREYFLLIWSATVQVGVVAHRFRKGSLSNDGDETGDRKQPLQTLCAFDGETVQSMIEGLETALAIATPEGTGSWRSTPRASDCSAAQLYANLLVKQLQKQEDLWHRNVLYRKQAEAAEGIQQQNQELQTALRQKDAFLNNAGQELRTPLTTIKTALSLLSSPSIKPPQRQRYMDLIAKECDRQSSLITSVLDLVQLDQTADTITLQPLSMADVVPGVVSTYQPLAEEKGVMLAYTVPEELLPVACVTNWLRQIVINLVHNGVKFTPKGGQVWVKAKAHGEFVQLEVRDTGVGIPPAEIPKIFDRFYKVRQAGDDNTGAGLGLTIVQQILVHCGGSVSVKSKPGEGTTFHVLLPLYKDPLVS